MKYRGITKAHEKKVFGDDEKGVGGHNWFSIVPNNAKNEGLKESGKSE
jgi:hypothetical protein